MNSVVLFLIMEQYAAGKGEVGSLYLEVYICLLYMYALLVFSLDTAENQSSINGNTFPPPQFIRKLTLA